MLRVFTMLLIAACRMRAGVPAPEPNVAAEAATTNVAASGVTIAVPRSCADGQATLVWPGQPAVEASIHENQFLFAVNGPPEHVQFVGARPGCHSDNGRLVDTLNADEKAVGRFAIGRIDSSCGPESTAVLWLDGQAPADYPAAPQGYSVFRRPTCAQTRDELFFYAGRPPSQRAVCAEPNEVIVQGSLSQALASAAPGDRLRVKPGIYRESFALKPGVELISDVVGAAVIVGTVNCADNAAISGFVVTGGHPGIACDGPFRTRISRNILRGNSPTGISCTNGCAAEIADNTIVGNLRDGDTPSSGVYVAQATPIVANNIIMRHDFGLRWTGEGSEHDNWLFENRQPIEGRAPAASSHTTDPELAAIERDDFRSNKNAGALKRDGSLSLAAQEYAVEAFFHATETSSGLQSDALLLPPASLTFTATDIPADGVALFRSVAAQLSTTVITEGSGEACRFVRIARSGAETMGEAYTSHFSGAPCKGDAHVGGTIAGGQMVLAGDVLDNLDDAETRLLVTHEAGHVFGLWHVFRAVSPMAYGPQRADYSGVDREALALRACETTPVTLDDWKHKGYITAAALEPFPAVERVQTINDRLHLFGSRFTLRFGSESGDVDNAHPVSGRPTVYLNDTAVSVDMTLTTSWHGGVTRNLEVDVPPGFTEGWLRVQSRGLSSIPLWISRH